MLLEREFSKKSSSLKVCKPTKDMTVRLEILFRTHHIHLNLLQCKNLLGYITVYLMFSRNIIRYKQKLKGKINNALNGTKTELLDSSVDRELKPMTDELCKIKNYQVKFEIIFT